MGRKREYPPIVFLPVFTEGEKLTKEQKEWLTNRKEIQKCQAKHVCIVTETPIHVKKH